MLDVMSQALRAELPEAQAQQYATRALAALARYHGGRMYYLPKGEALERALRDRDIYQRYTHRRESILELVEAYGLTEQHIYRIIAEQRALHVRRVQHALPLD